MFWWIGHLVISTCCEKTCVGSCGVMFYTLYIDISLLWICVPRKRAVPQPDGPNMMSFTSLRVLRAAPRLVPGAPSMLFRGSSSWRVWSGISWEQSAPLQPRQGCRCEMIQDPDKDPERFLLRNGMSKGFRGLLAHKQVRYRLGRTVSRAFDVPRGGLCEEDLCRWERRLRCKRAWKTYVGPVRVGWCRPVT